jgi:mannose-6-phosphate isomerase class I
MIQNTLPKIGQETSKNSILYKNCDFKEFFVVKFNLEEGEQMSYQLNNFSILILLKGDLIIKSDDEISIKKYGIYFLENNFTFNFKGRENESVEFYIASY